MHRPPTLHGERWHDCKFRSLPAGRGDVFFARDGKGPSPDCEFVIEAQRTLYVGGEEHVPPRAIPSIIRASLRLPVGSCFATAHSRAALRHDAAPHAHGVGFHPDAGGAWESPMGVHRAPASRRARQGLFFCLIVAKIHFYGTPYTLARNR